MDVAKLVAPVAPDAAGAIGKNIAQNQPNVEALAMVCRDFPVSEEKFDEMRGGREWVSLQVMIIALGKAGFSKVPYLASKKKGEKDENQMPLYEDSALTGGTTFSSFMKGKTNKDRGDRCLSVEENGVEIPTVATLQPGHCISAFMRAEQFASDSRFFVNRKDETVVPKFQFVHLELASQNVEQAKKGNLVKIKKMRLINDTAAIVGQHVKSEFFPSSIAAFEQRMSEARDCPAIAKQVYAGNYKYCRVLPHSDAHVTVHDDKYFVCSESKQDGMDEVYIARELLLQAVGTNDPDRACKIATIAIAMGALSMLVASARNDDVIMGGQDSFPHSAAFVHIEVNAFLCTHLLSSKDLPSDVNEFHIEHDDVCVSLSEGLLTWSATDKVVLSRDGQRKRVVFSLSTAPVEAKAAPWNNNMAPRMLGDGLPGPHHRLTIHFAGNGTEWKHVCALVPPVVQPGISLQVFPEHAVSAKSTKRKSLEAMDDRDDFGDLTGGRGAWAPKSARLGGENSAAGYSHDDDMDAEGESDGGAA